MLTISPFSGRGKGNVAQNIYALFKNTIVALLLLLLTQFKLIDFKLKWCLRKYIADYN